MRLDGRYHGVYVLMEKPKLHEDRIDLAEPAQLIEWTFSWQARKKGRFFRLPGRATSCSSRTRSARTWPARARRRARQPRRRRAGAVRRRVPRPAHRLARALDARAAVDYLLVNELFKNQDAFHASTYLARGAGGRWRLGPVWDFDISMGNSDYGPSAMLEGSMLEDRAWASRLYRDPAFVDALVARWEALRARGLRRDLLRGVDGTARGCRRAARRRATSRAGRSSASASGRTRPRR